MNQEPNSEAAETVQITNVPAVDLPRIVRRFEVLNRTGEHDWEEASGPYATYEEAEKARLNWFRKDDIPSMRVVEFHSPNAKLTDRHE
jgi:hypothetical protein